MLTTWTEDQLLKAKDLWENTPMSGKEIGVIVDKTRNAVIGRATRDGWVKMKREPKPIVIKIKKEKKLKPKKIEDFVSIIPEPKPVNIPKKLIECNEPLNCVAVFCREIIGDPKNGCICGLPVERGSYCKDHARINYMVRT